MILQISNRTICPPLPETCWSQHDSDNRQDSAPGLSAAGATGSPLQDASNHPDLSQRGAHPDAADLARKAHQAEQKRARRAAMSEQQAEAVRAANASAHKKSRSVRRKVPAAAAGYAALSMTVMSTLFRSSCAAAAAAAPPQQPIEPQPSATSASDLIHPTTLPQAIAPLPPLPAVPNMASVNPNQSIMHGPSHPPVQQHPFSLQAFPPVPVDPNMTGSTQGSMQTPPLSAQILNGEPAEPQRLTWLHVGAAKRTAPRQPAGGPVGPQGPPAPQNPSINPQDQPPHSPHNATVYAADLYSGPTTFSRRAWVTDMEALCVKVIHTGQTQ